VPFQWCRWRPGVVVGGSAGCSVVSGGTSDVGGTVEDGVVVRGGLVVRRAGVVDVGRVVVGALPPLLVARITRP
jgi:hypothetical protein